GEALLLRFAQWVLAVSDRPHLAGEADLTEGDERARHCPIGKTRGERDDHREVPSGLVDLDTAYGVDEDVMLLQRQRRVATQHREQHRQAIGIEALRDA